MKYHQTAIHWFRRVLRLDDNRTWNAALESSQTVLPVFIFDPDILQHPATGRARVQFLIEALEDLDKSLRELGGFLTIREGKPVEELSRLVQETGATGLFFSRDYEPYARQRDTAVKDALQNLGVTIAEFPDHLLVEPGDVLNQSGKPYTVFTPYKRVWLTQPILPPLDSHTQNARGKLLPATDEMDNRQQILQNLKSQIQNENDQQPQVHASEAEARKRLDTFIADCLEQYDSGRERPAQEGTSRLSAYLKMGVISPRRVLQEVNQKRRAFGDVKGLDTFISELAWRDFYYQILWHFPHVADGAFKPEYNDLQWENDETLFRAWCEGHTGYPFVDAAQRQMNREAWMHNRARMVTASFLTKDLLCNWQRGELYFMQKLVDGDQASNNGGWQWAASTGTDAQPFFRIFNPVTQGEKFDPDGKYVKHWVPELKRIPTKYVHKPWELSAAEQEAVGCVLGRDYPRPIVDHKLQREKALTLYRTQDSG